MFGFIFRKAISMYFSIYTFCSIIEETIKPSLKVRKDKISIKIEKLLDTSTQTFHEAFSWKDNCENFRNPT